MTRVLLAMSLAALGGCSSHDPARPGGTDGDPPSTTLVGTWLHRYHQHSGDLDVPVDAATAVTAWIPDPGPTGFRIAQAVRTGAGAFAIHDVPDGEVYLHLFSPSAVDTFYATDQRVIELRDEDTLRYMPRPAVLSKPTPLTLDVTGLTPYAAAFDVGDSIEIDSFEIGYHSLALAGSLHAGDTAIETVHDWRNGNTNILGIALPDSELGDEVEIVHYRSERRLTQTRQVVSTMHLADLLRASLRLVDGVPAMLGAQVPTLIADRKVTVSIDPGLDALTESATARRVGRSVDISAHPLWAESPLHVTLFELSIDLSQDPSVVPPLVDFPYADPLPPSWPRTVTIGDVRYRGYRYPGPISDSNVERILPLRSRVSTAYTGTVDTSTALPRPRDVVLGGQDFVTGGKLSFDGQTPIALTWSPVDSATAYHLDIWRLTPQYTMLAASFYTDRASLRIPASLFHDGDVLALILSAEQFPRATAGSLVPGGLPRRTAELASGRFRLTEHCGDGVVQAGEECDDGGETAACNADCTVAQCGDGIRNAAFGEDCDDVFATAGCSDTCTRTAPRRPEPRSE